MPQKLSPEIVARLKKRQQEEDNVNSDFVQNYPADMMGDIKGMFAPVFGVTNALKKMYQFLENRSYYDIGNLR